MSFHRYLLNFSYIGTNFHGAQRQVPRRLPTKEDPTTVAGRIEMGLKLLNPSQHPTVHLSSRTDAGVHAFSSTCHVDLHRCDGFRYEPQTVTVCLNKYFKQEEVPIRVLKTYVVPDDFSCRFRAVSRTYLYRLGVIKTDTVKFASYLQLLPIEELERCYLLCSDVFDVAALRESAEMFVGLHDFRTFMSKSSWDLQKNTRRVIQRFEVCDGVCRTYSPYSWGPHGQSCQFLDVYVQATGFLYRQVRRMVASLVAVAQGKVSSSDIKSMLEVPSHRSWNERIKTVPAHGLYLCDVEYSERDRAVFRDSLRV